MSRWGGSTRAGVVGLLSLAAAFLFAPVTHARGESIPAFELTADSVEHRERDGLYIAQGQVHLVQGARTLRANWVAFSVITREGVASGDVRLDEGDQRIEAAFLQFDVDSLSGRAFDGVIDTGEGGFRVRAAELVRLGELRYALRDGSFTTCRCPPGPDGQPAEPPPWRIDASRADVELGGYGRATNTTLAVLGVPVVWLPWLIVPVKTERETGLLFPELAYGGANGVQVGLPFFWAAREDVGVIVTPRYLHQRGFKPDAEIEYLLGARASGRLSGSYLRDRSGEASLLETDRWDLHFEHDQPLGAAWRARADLNLVSDNRYLDDFDEFGRYRRGLFLRSVLFAGGPIAGRSGRVAGSVAMAYADDVTFTQREDRDDTLLQRWPDLWARVFSGPVSIPGADTPALGLVTAFDARHTYFHAFDDPLDVFPNAQATGFWADTGIDPRESALEATELDSRYQEGEPMLEGGHRLRLHPRLARPISLFGVADLYPEVGYAQSLYSGRRTGPAERGVWHAEAELRSRWQREYATRTGVVHLVEPFLRWGAVRERGDSGAPVFTPPSVTPQGRLRQASFGNRVQDPADRQATAHLVAAGAENRVYSGGRLWGELGLSYQYDFESVAGRAAVVEARLLPTSWLSSRAQLALASEAPAVEEAAAEIALRAPDWRFLSHIGARAGYRHLRRVPLIEEGADDEVSQLDFGGGLRLFGRIGLGYDAVYSERADELISQAGSAIYVSRCRCWGVGVRIEADRTRDVYFALQYTLTGLGRDRGDPFALRPTRWLR